jgi:hypothetical protein
VIGFTIWLLFISATLAYSAATKSGRISFLEQPKSHREVMLFGDSLIGVPNFNFHMGDSIEKSLRKSHPDYDVHVSISADNGNCVKDLLDRVDRYFFLYDIKNTSVPDANNNILL